MFSGVTNLSTLPIEILHEIISYMASSLPTLVRCSRVCKSLSEVTNAALYHNIDLTRDELGEHRDEEADEKTDERQAKLIRSIAENPRLGSLVREFRNHNKKNFGELGDATTDPSLHSELLIRAAKNMTRLSKAYLTANPVAAHIITNLPSYSRLVDLTVKGLKIEEHIWGNAPVALRKLAWTAPVSLPGCEANQKDQCDTISMLLNVVEATCPGLESLDFSFSRRLMGEAVPELPTAARERVQQYVKIKGSDMPVLPNLQHIGLLCYRVDEETHLYDQMLEGLMERYSHSLTSIAIPIGHGPWTRILKMCQHLPRLKSISLNGLTCDKIGIPGDLHAKEFLREVTTSLASPKFEIERLSIISVYSSFSEEMGTLFRSMKSLKYLFIGDGVLNDCPYGSNDSPSNGYKPEILGFIKALPPSLEELVIEVNGIDLWYDEDDYYVLCDMGPEIFSTLRRLRSCDIRAWIIDFINVLYWTPEKGIFYRRLPHVGDEQGPTADLWQKDLWTSRMDDTTCNEDGAQVKCTIDFLTDSIDGGKPFEGPDADEAWLGGWTYERPAWRSDKPDYSWPFWTNKVKNYEGFRDRYS